MNQKPPYLEVSGSHSQVGQAIGTKFKDIIHQDIEANRANYPQYQTLIDKTQSYWQAVKRYFPNLATETEAIAQAAAVPTAEYFLNNVREIHDPAEEIDEQDSINHDHCTVIASFNSQGVIVGHNEDWSMEALNQTYILKATINDTTFIGFNYQLVVPGVAASVNSWGLVQCINDLYQTNQIGVPKNYLARAILECRTLDQAEAILKNTPRASGFNHVLVQGSELRNIEIAGHHLATETITKGSYVHTNHYLNQQLKVAEKFHTQSSETRYQRAQEIIQPKMSVDQITTLLKDTHDPKYPICRLDATVGSAIFDPVNHTAYFCYGPPCLGEYIEYQY